MGYRPVVWASMPKAAIDKNRNPGTCKDKIWADADVFEYPYIGFKCNIIPEKLGRQLQLASSALSPDAKHALCRLRR